MKRTFAREWLWFVASALVATIIAFASARATHQEQLSVWQVERADWLKRQQESERWSKLAREAGAIFTSPNPDANVEPVRPRFDVAGTLVLSLIGGMVLYVGAGLVRMTVGSVKILRSPTT